MRRPETGKQSALRRSTVRARSAPPISFNRLLTQPRRMRGVFCPFGANHPRSAPRSIRRYIVTSL
jgi:hypothetical protein